MTGEESDPVSRARTSRKASAETLCSNLAAIDVSEGSSSPLKGTCRVLTAGSVYQC